MKITLNFQGNIYNLMRQLGYHPVTHEHEKKGELSFARRFNSSHYPHFHVYLQEVSRGTFGISLHLDQKKPSYEGAPAHSGEYQGDLLEKEAERIKRMAGRY